ncbi:MAG: cysteine--tRNA ligase [Nitrospirae bacterium]|nr:cysteine--tRNA ligase [Nitrospirota bacterium]
MLKIYNTLSGKKEVFEPLIPWQVGMYVCGVTVYDLCHIGHARSALVFDVIRNYFEYKGFKVTYIRNFTDIDDKIIARAQREGLIWKDVAEKYIREYYSDMKLLGVREADIEPKATEHIDEMQNIISGLMENGHAYSTDGDVFYKVKSFGDYGKLSKRNTEDMLAGARVEIDERKADPLDFALWKSSKPGEPEWESPWGVGRPGWHIECSAMSMKYLGAPFDIHGGGKDLIFPHHENEIAQSEAFSGKAFARYWIHNGFVNVNQEKMSKSLGNFFTIREVIEKYPCSPDVTSEILRYFIISNHYRSPFDFSDHAMNSAHAALDGFYSLFQKIDEIKQLKAPNKEGDHAVRNAIIECKKDFLEAMDDDFNTAGAIACLQKFKKEFNTNLNQGISDGCATEIESFIKGLGGVLGIFQVKPDEWEFSKSNIIIIAEPGKFVIEGQTAELKHQLSDKEENLLTKGDENHPTIPPLSKGGQRGGRPGLSNDEINRLVSEREEARKNKNWKRSDEIRDMLAKSGIILEDRPDGSTRIKR